MASPVKNQNRNYLPPPPYSYRPGSGFLYTIPTALKLLFLLLLSFFAYISIPGLIAAALLVLAGALSVRIKPWELLRGSRPLLVLILFILLFRSVNMGEWAFNRKGFFGGSREALAVIIAYAAGSLFFFTTTQTRIRDSLGGGKISLAVSLMLGFIPRFFEIWENTSLACEARGAKKGPGRILLLVPLVTERMLEKAAETADALEVRGLRI